METCMPLLELNLTPSQKDLRCFAALWWPAVCGVIGAILFKKFHAPGSAMWVWIGGGLIATMGVVSPSAIRPFYLGFIRLTYPIGFIVSHLVLAAIYFLIITPIGALVRIFHDPMERTFEPEASSYWIVRDTIHNDRYFRQL
jgi:hypothetical protein